MGIKALIQKYESNIDYYRSSRFNETQLRADFLDPFFELLGWDINNKKGKSNHEREVLLEESLRENIATNLKKPDYTFRLFSERKFFLEAKKSNVRIETDSSPAKQLRRYGYTAKLKISVLSNFEYLAIYDCSEKVNPDDSVEKCRIKLYHYTEYEDKFKEIIGLLGYDSVYTGRFDTEWEHIEDKLSLYGVDRLFLQQINEWRIILGNEVFKIRKNISETELNDLVQSYLNSIIFLRVCEDRNIETYQTLLKFANDKDFKSLIQKFYDADKKYNSGLFIQEHKEEIIENSQSVFWTIIKQLYYPESPYSFSVFSSDILGNIYEIFVAQKLAIEDDALVLKDKPEHEDRDVITTPTNIIHDILGRTIIPYCSGKSVNEILSLKISDIACGSGAFLFESFQLICDLVIDLLVENDKEKLIQTSVNTYKLPFDLKKQILKNCIWGVDKDFNAIKAARFGLLLKLLEEENTETISKDHSILPDLSDNLIFGNSLIQPGNDTKGKEEEINPFDFSETKFDIIVGNPPYMSTEDMKNITPLELPIYKKQFDTAFKQFDKYYLFIERGIQLLKPNGYLGFIIPSKFTKVGAAKNLRKLLSENRIISQIISFGANQIFKGKTTYTCLLITHNLPHELLDYYEVNNYRNWMVRDYHDYYLDQIPISHLSSETWVLMPGYLKEPYNKIVSQCEPLGEIVGEKNIYNGIQTSANRIYIHNVENEDDNYVYFTMQGTKWKIEKSLTKPYFQTSTGIDNLYTYRPLIPNSIVIYPYKKIDEKIELIEIDEMRNDFPFTYKFLNNYKSFLANPKRDIKPVPENENEWYRYGRHQSLDKCDVPAKIVVGVLSQGNKYAIDYYGTLISSGGTAGYCMINIVDDSEYSIYYFQALLNSKYLEWFSSLYGEVFRGGYIARGTKVLKQLPIRVINFEDKNEKEIHDRIAETQRQLIDKQVEIDNSVGNSRKLIIARRQFKSLKQNQDNNLKQLFELGDLDNNIPLISEMYGAN